MKRTLLGLSLFCIGAATIFSACSSKSKGHGVSEKTGWNYNDSRLGGFTVAEYDGQVTAPGLTFVEGGRFAMGQTDEDLTLQHNNVVRTVSVNSFYMDKTEVANVDYREYLYDITRKYNADYPEVVAKALPDTLVWRSALSYNEPLVSLYFRHASYNFYPVVGVNWYQANDYCKWRTDRVNEMMLIKKGILKKNPNQVNEDVYTTGAYRSGQYLGTPGKRQPRDLDPNGAKVRQSSYADGILLPPYRLPTEAEWEYAALGLIDKNPTPQTKRRRGEEALTDRKNYPWGDARTIRDLNTGGDRGKYYANTMRGRGDAMGTVGGLNDNAALPSDVYSYGANAYGLYNMAGNVSEWVIDVYRPGSSQDYEEINPVRQGTLFTKPAMEPGEVGVLAEKDSLGNMTHVDIDSTDIAGRYNINYNSDDARDALDGDSASGYVYSYGNSTLINDDVHVIKGGSWKDRPYWMVPGTRRFMLGSHSSATVGFRCVMDRLGSADGGNSPSGNTFSQKHKRRR